jgi:hypothetical protein
MIVDYIEITVRKFEGLVKRNDIKSPQWFAMPNEILLHPDFFDISGDEFKVFSWVCGVASKLNSATIRVYPKLCSRQINVDESCVTLTIEKLNGKRWDVTDALRARYADVTLQDRTGQDRTGGGEEKPPPFSFRENKYYKRLSVEIKQALEATYPADFLNTEIIEIHGYLEGKGFQQIHRLDSFIPKSLKTSWRWFKENEKQNQTPGGMVKEL